MTTITEASGQTRLATCEDTCPHGDDIHRDRFGRPVIDGRSRTRVSTLAGTLEDQGGLITWKAGMALKGATETHLRQARMGEPIGPIVEDAATRGGAMDAATEGTMAHEHCLTYLADPDAFDPTPLDARQGAMVAAFAEAVDQAGLRYVHHEQFVVASGWAGTYDLALADDEGRVYLADIKTGAKEWDAKYPMKVATQLAAYAAGTRYCPVSGWLATPAWSGLLLITVPLNKGTAKVLTVNRDRADHLLDLALTVRGQRSDQRTLAQPYMPEEARK